MPERQSSHMIDSHCHLADEAFERSRRRRRGRVPACGRAVHPVAGDDEEESARAHASGDLAGGPLRAWRSIRTRRDVRRTPATAGAVASAFGGRLRRVRSARSASTITTISRRATCSSEVFARRSALARELDAADRHPHAGGDRRHVRASCARRARRLRGVFHCFTGDARWRARRSTSAFTSRLPES